MQRVKDKRPQPLGGVASHLSRMTPKIARRNDHILTLIDANPPIVTMLTGWAIRYWTLPDKRRQIINVLLPGDTAGVEMIVKGTPTFAVQAISHATYAIMFPSDLFEFSSREGWFRQRLIEHLVRERSLAEERLIFLGQLTAEERIATLFLDLHERLQQRRLASGNMFHIELTQQHIADLVGLTPVHTNRVLQRLRASGFVSVNDHQVTISDMPALRRLAALHSLPHDSLPLFSPPPESEQAGEFREFGLPGHA